MMLWLVVPLIASMLSLTRVREAVTLTSAVVCLIGSIELIRYGIVSKYFYVDKFSALIVFITSAVYLLSSLYSIHFVRCVKKKFYRTSYYYALLNLFAFTMMLTAVLRDIGLMWVGLETTTIVSAILVAFEKKKTSIEAAWRYIIVASAGLGLALISLITLHAYANTLLWDKISVPVKVANLTLVFALIGFGTKIGLFPMHTWLPDAHGTAPPTVSAMLSANLLPLAMLCYYRILQIAVHSGSHMAQPLTCIFGIVTALMAGIFAMPQRIIKRLFAYSSMDVMGIALVGLGLGGKAVLGSMIILLIHAFAKSGLFFCAGNVITCLGVERIDEVSGLLEVSKLTGLAMLMNAFAVTGVPPFATFLGELIILAYSLRYPKLAIMLAMAILISFLAVNYHVTNMTFGRGEGKISRFAEVVAMVSAILSFGFSVPIVWEVIRHF